jgi:hypothetical protein
MFDQRISALNPSPISFDVPLEPVHSLLAALDGFALAGLDDVASQQEFSAFTPLSLGTRYAAANPITRRRFDALLRETETIAQTGIALIVGRGAKADGSTIVAARFLGKSVAASLRKLDALLAPQAV